MLSTASTHLHTAVSHRTVAVLTLSLMKQRRVKWYLGSQTALWLHLDTYKFPLKILNDVLTLHTPNRQKVSWLGSIRDLNNLPCTTALPQVTFNLRWPTAPLRHPPPLQDTLFEQPDLLHLSLDQWTLTASHHKQWISLLSISVTSTTINTSIHSNNLQHYRPLMTMRAWPQRCPPRPQPSPSTITSTATTYSTTSCW